MNQPSTLVLDNHTLEFHVETGTVTEARSWVEQEIIGRGGGGAMQYGYGSIAPIYIETKNRLCHQLFLHRENGSELSFSVVSRDLAVRQGHKVSVAFVRVGSETGGPYFLRNHATKVTTTFDEQLAGLEAYSLPPQGFKQTSSMTSEQWLILGLFVGGALLCFENVYMGVAAMIGAAIWGKMANKRRLSQIQEFVRGLHRRIVTELG